MLNLLLTLAIIGVLLWILNTMIPMDEKIKKLINAIVIITVVLYILRIFGVIGHVEVPSLR